MTAQIISQHEDQARKRFDEWSESRTFQRLSSWLAYVQIHLLDRIDWSQTHHFLDIACGSGWAVHQAAQRIQSSEGLACGCDLSQGMLRQRAACGEIPNVHLNAASAQAFPYNDDVFDVAICTAAFHHFPEPLAALCEIQRILRPGGTLYIADTCRDQSVGTWIWDRLHRWFEQGHVKYYRTDELLFLLNNAGFRQAKVVQLNPSYADTGKLVRKVGIFSAIAP